MRPLKTLALAAGLALTALPASAQTAAPSAPWGRYAAARQVELRDVVAIVQVTPENRTDVAVSISNPGPLRAPQMRMRGDRLVIDGAMRRQIRSCTVRGEGFTVATARNGRLERPQIMTINIRVPQAAAISAGGAVRLHMAPAQSTELRLSGCGDADIERINDEADIAVSGSPDVRVYEAGSATIAVAGAGDVTLGQQQFQFQCAACHQANGSGQGPALIGPDSPVIAMTDEQLFELVREGTGHTGQQPVSTMRISDRQLASIILYIRTQLEDAGSGS